MTNDNTERSESGGESPTIDEVFQILADGTRRALLFELLDRSPDAAVRLVPPDRVADLLGTVRGKDEDTGGRGGVDGDRLLTSLRHNHLPRLVEAEVVCWDRDRGIIERGPAFEAVEPFLGRLDEVRDDLSADRGSRSEGVE